jgi:hypothetical protein
MANKNKIVTPDLEKSFSKQTDEMKKVIDQAMEQGTIKVLVNRSGNKVDLSKIIPAIQRTGNSK